jgi:hypothetical protein
VLKEKLSTVKKLPPFLFHTLPVVALLFILAGILIDPAESPLFTRITEFFQSTAPLSLTLDEARAIRVASLKECSLFVGIFLLFFYLAIRGQLLYGKHVSPRTLSLFFLFFYLAPVWLFPRFPSQDGPLHLLNTEILSQLLETQQGFYHRYFEINAQPFPNWFLSLFLLGFKGLMPLPLAEKLLVSLYIILLPVSLAYFMGSCRFPGKSASLLSFLFAYNYCLMVGLYNFCLSLPFFFFTLGYWLKIKDCPRATRILLLNGLLLLLYSCHLVSFSLLLVFSGLLAVTDYGITKRALEAWAPLSPGLFYLVIAYLTLESEWNLIYPSFVRAVGRFIFPRSLIVFDSFDMLFALAAFLATVAYALFLFKRRSLFRKKNPFFLFGVILLALSFFLPDGLLGGSYTAPRIILFAYLFFIVSLGEFATGPVVGRAVPILLALAIVQTGHNLYYFKEVSGELDRFTSGISKCQRNKRFLPVILFDTHGYFFKPFLWAAAYYCMETEGLEPNNHQARTIYFPVRFKGADLPTPGEWYPSRFRMSQHGKHYDYMIIWGHSPLVDDEVQGSEFELIHEEEKLKLYGNSNRIGTG